MSTGVSERSPEDVVDPAGPWARRRLFRSHDKSSRRVREASSIVRLVVLYMLAALGAFVLCAVGLALAQRHAALQEAVRDAEATSALLATRVVQPALPASSLTGLGADEAFDRVVRAQVLRPPVTQVRVVDETGAVLYSTEAGSAGQRVVLSSAELRALQTTGTAAYRDDGADPTRLDGGRDGQALDVSAGLQAPSGQSVLLQTRQSYQVVWLGSRALWRTTLPSLLLALGLLYLVKIGFTYRLTRGLYGMQEGREQLLVTALAAADRERTLIAADLHDGVVQGLAGASYTLTDAADRVRAGGQPDIADSIAGTARSLRQWVRELRSLIVTVTPPALHSEGLRATLTDLVATLEARQIEVELDVQVSDTLPDTAESLAYRVAQEAIRNVVRHARASKVGLVVVEERGWLSLQLTDDGQGFDPSMSARRSSSVGLTLLAALVHQQGGILRVESATGAGTAVTMRLPVHAPAAAAELGSRSPR
jgi:two-component system NarL family sensor kinase